MSEENLEETIQLYEEIYFHHNPDDTWSLISDQVLNADLAERSVAFDVAVEAGKTRKPLSKKASMDKLSSEEIVDNQLEDLGLKPTKSLKKKMQKLAATTVFSNLDFDRPNPSEPISISKAPTHSAQQMAIDQESMAVSNSNGFAMAKATHGFEFGNWFFEISIPESAQGNYRLGVAQILAESQAPIGFDEYSYGYRGKDGRLLHCGRTVEYGESFGPGDVIGVKLVLPSSADAETSDGNREDLEAKYPPKRLGKYKVRQEILADGSHFEFFRNGRSQGKAFVNPYRAKYYPSASLYGGATCVFNFGPDFRFPRPEVAKPAYLIVEEVVQNL